MLLFRYFSRQLWQYFSVILVTIITILWLTQTVRYNDMLSDKGLDLFTIAGFVGLLLPSIVSPVTPYAFLIAVILSLIRLIQRHEMTIMRGLGMSPKDIARWVLFNAVLVMALLYFLMADISPSAYHKFKLKQHFLKRNLINFSLQPRTFNTPIPGLTIYVEAQDQNGEYHGLVMHDNRPNQPGAITIAKTARLTKTASDEIIFELFNGSRHGQDSNGREQILSFEHYPLNISQKADSMHLSGQEVREMPIGKLIRELRKTNKPILAAELHHRLFWPMLIPAFSLVAIARLNRYHPRYHSLPHILAPLVLKVILISAVAIAIQIASKNSPNLGYLGYVVLLTYSLRCWRKIRLS